jgi:hypothetical protein
MLKWGKGSASIGCGGGFFVARKIGGAFKCDSQRDRQRVLSDGWGHDGVNFWFIHKHFLGVGIELMGSKRPAVTPLVRFPARGLVG